MCFALPTVILNPRSTPALLRTVLSFGTLGFLSSSLAKLSMEARQIRNLDELRYLFESGMDVEDLFSFEELRRLERYGSQFEDNQDKNE